MSSTQITGGSIKYIEPSNYNTGKTGCEVTIHFTVGEGDGVSAAAMGDMARYEAFRLASGQAAPPLAPPLSTRAVPTGDTLIGDASTGTSVQGVIGTSTGPIATTAAPPSEAVVVGGPRVTATTSEAVVIGYPPTQAAAPAASPSINAAPSSARSPSEAANGHDAGISDLDLRGAVERKLAQFDPGKDADAISRQRGPIAVAQLLAQYVTPPAKVYALTPEQRPDFVAKLAALTLT